MFASNLTIRLFYAPVVRVVSRRNDEFFEEISDDEPTRAELEMLDHWGEKCDEYQEGCIACKAWKHFDKTGEVMR
jgi:hypothetical protein